MDSKQAHAEMVEIARELSHLPGALDLSSRMLEASIHLAELPGDDEPDTDPEKEAVAYLDAEMETLPKSSAWWLPPRNFAINQALGGYNMWQFTILPFFPKKTAYRSDLQGIVIHPVWRPVKDLDFGTLDMGIAKKLVAYARQASTVQETARKELEWIEREFSIRIPEAIVGKIVKDVLPTAKRRWKVDRMRVKDELFPLDGSPPRNLGAWT